MFVLTTVTEKKNNIINVAHPKQLHFIISGFVFAAKEGFMLID